MNLYEPVPIHYESLARLRSERLIKAERNEFCEMGKSEEAGGSLMFYDNNLRNPHK